MEGNEYLKKERLEHGYSFHVLARATGIKERSLYYYENGEKALDRLMVDKILSLFKPLGINIELFFDEFYGYKSKCEVRMKSWKESHPRIYDYLELKRKSYDCIAQLKQRRTVNAEQFDRLLSLHRNAFPDTHNHRLTDDEYDHQYLEFVKNCKIVLFLNYDRDSVLKDILLALFSSEYTSSTFSGFMPRSFADLIGYSSAPKLRKILSGAYGLDSLNILAALNLCYVLNLDFLNTFGVVKNHS